MSTKETFTCQHCGAEADMTLEGFEKVEDIIKRGKKSNLQNVWPRDQDGHRVQKKLLPVIIVVLRRI